MDHTTRLPRGTQPSQTSALPSSAPDHFIASSRQPSYWEINDPADGMAVQQAFAKACHHPELFIAAATVIDWRSANGWLSNACITEALDVMQRKAVAPNRSRYDTGPHRCVDWTDAANLQAAIYQGPVKIGVDAERFEDLWFAHNPNYSSLGDDWFAAGFPQGNAEHFPVSLCGYGAIFWLAGQLGAALPSGVDGSQPGYALFTGSTVGIIDAPSLLNITRTAYGSDRQAQQNLRG